MGNSLRRLGRELASQKRQAGDLNNARGLSFSAFAGTVEQVELVDTGEVDELGEPILDNRTVVRIGVQPDGTNAVVVLDGPQPPSPDGLSVVDGNGLITAIWDGTFAGGAAAPADFRHVAVHVAEKTAVDALTLTMPSPETVRSTISTLDGAEAVVASLPPVEHYVALQTVTVSGQSSVLYEVVTANPGVPASGGGPASDGLAPAASPAVTVVGGISAVHLSWPAVVNADPVTYRVELVSTAGPEEVPVWTAPTVAGSTPGTTMTIPELDASRIYHVRLVASDVDGAAAAGVAGSAQPRKVSAIDLSLGVVDAVHIADGVITADKMAANSVTGDVIDANYVYAGEVSASQLRSGEVTADLVLSGSIKTAQQGARVEQDADGIRVYQADGAVTTVLTTTGDNSFHGEVGATNLTVEDEFVIRHTMSVAADAAIVMSAKAISDPTVPPAVSTYWPTGVRGLQTVDLCNDSQGRMAIYSAQPGSSMVNETEYAHTVAGDTVVSTETFPNELGVRAAGRRYTTIDLEATSHTLFSRGSDWFLQRQLAEVLWFADLDTVPEGPDWLEGAASITGDGRVRFTSQTSAGNYYLEGIDAQWKEITFVLDITASKRFAQFQLLSTDYSQVLTLFFHPSGDWDVWHRSGSAAATKIHNGGKWDGGRADISVAVVGTSLYVSGLGAGAPNVAVPTPWAAATFFDSVAAIFGWASPTGYTYVEALDLRVESSYAYPYPRLNTANMPVLGNDGTSIVVSEVHPTTGKVTWRHYAPMGDLTAVVKTVTASTAVPGRQCQFSTMVQGDFSGPRYLVGMAGSEVIRSYNTAGVEQPTEHFQTPAASAVGVGWSAASGFVVVDSSGTVYACNGHTWTDGGYYRPQLFAYTWYDANTAGGTHETKPSPAAAFSPRRRARTRVNVPAIPVGATDDSVDSMRIYVGLAGGSLYLHGGARTTAVASLSGFAFAGPVPPAASNFPNSTPGIIRNDSSSLIISGDGVVTATGLVLPGDTAWIQPALLNGFITRTGYEVRYRRVGNVVSVQGQINLATGARVGTVFTLPAGFRPPTDINMNHWVGASAYVGGYINAAGTVYVTTALTTGYCYISATYLAA